MTEDLGIWAVPIAMLGGAIRVSTPFLFVSLGECLTERSGRINLGLEGTLVFGAMAGYALAYESNSAWIGVLAAAIAGAVFGLLHGWLCRFKGVNDIAMGIALMLLGIGLAFFFGKPYIQPVAPDLPSLPLGWWSEISQLRAALQVNVLFLLGIGLAFGMAWMFRNTALGLRIRVVGDSAEAARAIGIAPDRVRLWSTAAGGAFAGVAGAYLSLYYPGSWNEGLWPGPANRRFHLGLLYFLCSTLCFDIGAADFHIDTGQGAGQRAGRFVDHQIGGLDERFRRVE